MKRFIFVILLAFIILLPQPAYAIDLPDSTPSLTNVRVYRHLLQTDDFLLTATYNIPYAVLPDSNVAQAYVFRLLDTDGTTELGSNEAYPYFDYGYGSGLISFYFDNSTAPTWGSDYSIQIAGKPGMFDSLPSWNFVVNAADYSSLTTQDDNQDSLYSNIISLASDLEIEWSLELLDSGDGGTVLSASGEIYFRQSIQGLQLMCPALFLVQIEDPVYEDREWSENTSDNYSARYTGTWIGDAIDDTADFFSLEFNYIASIPIVLGMVLCIVAGAKQNNIYSGMLGALAVFLLGVVNGWTPMVLIGLSSLLAAVYMGWNFFLKGAQ